MRSRFLDWSTVFPGVSYYVARHFYKQGEFMDLHHHDFAEVFWVEKGTMVHTANNGKSLLSPGELVLIRPSDSHQMRPRSGGRVVFVNVAFQNEVLQAVKARYFPRDDTFWGGLGRFPEQHRINKKEIARLAAAAEELVIAKGSLFGIERFLLNLLQLVGRTPDATLPEEFPPWLSHALRGIAELQWAAKGTRGFVELCERSPEHVARAARRYLHTTPTEIVNDARMQAAARNLVLSDRPLSLVALDCGIASMPHFHKLFRKKFGCSPRNYRMRNRAVAG